MLNGDVFEYILYAGVTMYILNTDFFGYIMQSEEYEDTNEASEIFLDFKLKTLGKFEVNNGSCGE